MDRTGKSSTTIITIMALICFYGVLAGHYQEIIENPEIPPAENAGRVIKLTKVMQIDTEGRSYYFNKPRSIKIAKDGTIYVQEDSKLFKFSADGKFEKNLLKRGQGPGELSSNLNDFILGDNEIILFSSNESKVVRIDPNGNLIEDLKLSDIFINLIGYYGGNYFFTKYIREARKRKTEIREQKLQLYRVKRDREVSPIPIYLPITVSEYIGKFNAINNISRVQTLDKSQKDVYLFHTPNYLVKLLDLEKNKITQSFRRKYHRLKKQIVVNRNNFRPSIPEPKYKNDIYWLLSHNNNLWVVTKTFDKKNGLLVDVFSFDGKYLDNFYLPILSAEKDDWIFAPMAVHGNYLFVIEKDEDDLCSVVKYEMQL